MQTAMLVDSLWVLLTRLVMRAANFAVFLLLARSLSVGEFGFYGYVISTALVLAIAFDLAHAVIPAGDRLMVTLRTPADSQADLLLLYDHAGYPSSLSITTKTGSQLQ